jgi:hypothetical protein
MDREEIDLLGLRSVIKRHGINAATPMVQSLADVCQELRARIRKLESENTQMMWETLALEGEVDELKRFIKKFEN